MAGVVPSNGLAGGKDRYEYVDGADGECRSKRRSCRHDNQIAHSGTAGCPSARLVGMARTLRVVALVSRASCGMAPG